MLKKSTTRPICGYCNGCKKNQQLFTKPICEYCNVCKKLTTIYETYMWILQCR
jgi:hypothetical protein